ncbi:hypothetical protein L5515_008828 [Caenorhabditis briggsae]|uniref:F-box domain-containing protein n=1 Tax=Caenorhabditis briggsae TaxID=6238 RepID=A0AAE9F2I8_CAEBR|nr:hypothetical protein L5515_008828 [Caenorhabditis briggsae]
MPLKRKISETEESEENMKKKKHPKLKRKWQAEEEFLGLQLLPSNVMRTIVEKMSVEEHANFRKVCYYAHDEVESYWRSQRSISISQLMIWFPKLSESKWKLTSLSGILDELSAVFYLFKPGNLRKLSLCRVASINMNSLVKCIELSTGMSASKFLENVEELDLRGCFLSREHIKMIDELFPNLKALILHQNAIMPERNIKLPYKKQNEITHYVKMSSDPKHVEYGNVPEADKNVKCLVLGDHLCDVDGVPVTDKDVARDLLVKNLQEKGKVTFVVERPESIDAKQWAKQALATNVMQPPSVQMNDDVRNIAAQYHQALPGLKTPSKSAMSTGRSARQVQIVEQTQTHEIGHDHEGKALRKVK